MTTVKTTTTTRRRSESERGKMKSGEAEERVGIYKRARVGEREKQRRHAGARTHFEVGIPGGAQCDYGGDESS
jgi:hypothetical protein